LNDAISSASQLINEEGRYSVEMFKISANERDLHSREIIVGFDEYLLDLIEQQIAADNALSVVFLAVLRNAAQALSGSAQLALKDALLRAEVRAYVVFNYFISKLILINSRLVWKSFHRLFLGTSKIR
jgi:hypothetical protein